MERNRREFRKIKKGALGRKGGKRKERGGGLIFVEKGKSLLLLGSGRRVKRKNA